MSFKVQSTGQINLVDETSGNTAISISLDAIFTTITGASHQHYDSLPLVSTDNEKALPLGTLAGIRYVVLWAEGGTVTFRHGGNASGIEVNGAMIFQGVCTVPTIQTASTTPITVRYLILE